MGRTKHHVLLIGIPYAKRRLKRQAGGKLPYRPSPDVGDLPELEEPNLAQRLQNEIDAWKFDQDMKRNPPKRRGGRAKPRFRWKASRPALAWIEHPAGHDDGQGSQQLQVRQTLDLPRVSSRQDWDDRERVMTTTIARTTMIEFAAVLIMWFAFDPVVWAVGQDLVRFCRGARMTQ
jgi:hypothetical protein